CVCHVFCGASAVQRAASRGRYADRELRPGRKEFWHCHLESTIHAVSADLLRILGSLLARIHHFATLYPRLHQDRKSTRLNSSHRTISYAVFCLKKKKKKKQIILSY